MKKITCLLIIFVLLFSINFSIYSVSEDNIPYDISSTQNSYAEKLSLKTTVTSAEAKNAATSGTCGTNVTWNYNASTYTLTISGTGKMSSYSYSSYNAYYVTTAPWREYYNKMKTLVINSGVTSIGEYAFLNCTGLTSITIPDSVTSIGSSAFRDCTGLTRITIGNSVTSIGYEAFSGCTGLESIVVANSNKQYHSSGNCLINTKSKALIAGCKSSVISDDGSVTSIGDYAFKGCTGLKRITIPDSVTSIGCDAFYGCTGLTSITIPDSVTSIGSYAFQSCYSLTSIIIPNSVTSIGEVAFSGCIGLKTVYFLGFEEDWEKISIGSFNDPFTNATKVFPEECGANAGWMIVNNTLHIKGSGATDNYKTQASVPWYSQKDNITEIQIDSTITNIGTYSFYCLDNLKTVKSENKDLQLSKYSLNADNKNITVYSTGGGAFQEYCDQNGINFVKPTPDTPSAPVLSSVNGTSITVIEEPGTEYSLDKTNWQDSGVFTGLTSLTQYSVYARIKENKEYNASGISVALTVKTTKLNNDNIPPAPTLKSITSSSISVNAETGIEYSINGTSWNTTGTFSGLKSGTEYSIFARYKATATHFASMPSEPLTVKTDKATVSAPAAPDYEAHTENSITLKPNSKYEFSMDGENWQKSNLFTGLEKNIIYRFYQRVAETDTEYTSEKSPALITAIPDRPEILSASYDEITVKGINGFE